MNLEGQYTLCLNANWQPIGVKTPKEAIVALCSESYHIDSPYVALNITYSEDGKLEGIVPTKWDDWILLKPRPSDLVIHSSKLSIRVPSVIVASNFNKMPIKNPRLTKKAIWERDNSTCQVTGQKVTKATGNIEHLTPLSRGGENKFTNMVVLKKELNSRKGNRTLAEVGWKLIKKPKYPLPRPVSLLIKRGFNRDWDVFLT